jgi:SAM-dependent methyltransferase
VIAYGLLDHVPERRPVLDQIRHVLKPGGIFLASAGGRSHLGELDALVRPFLPDVSFGGEPTRFGLENGAFLLSPWFSEIQLNRFDDVLVFEQAGPLLAYILSEAETRLKLGDKQEEALRAHVKNILDRHGPFQVKVEKGVFTARGLPAL